MQTSEALLLNLAIIKVNWDENRDIVHNFMPIVGYAISRLPTDTVSTDGLKEIIQDVAHFGIPTGALESLIRRASRNPYGYVRREGAAYKRVTQKIPVANFESERAAVKSEYDQLFVNYRDFCIREFGDFEEDNAALTFFDFLFEFAPHIARSAVDFFDREKLEELEADERHKFRSAKFILNAIGCKGDDAQSIDSFVKGAILAESFYYTSSDNIKAKFRGVDVIYDTNILVQLLGYAAPAEVKKARELHEMVRASQARPRVFDINYTEVHGILTAALAARRYGPLRPRAPGDVFDILNRRGASASDIELEIGRLPSLLDKFAIRVIQAPEHTEDLGVDLLKLESYIREEIRYNNDQALSNDVDALASVFRLRSGKIQRYLESCGAIFVTTNSSLARASTRFFNEEYGVSDAPVCISDHVFCMLLWLKVAEKRPDIPTDLLVATCMAALQPSSSLWERYIHEVDRLRERGDITPEDYALLAHSIEARQALMDLTEGDTEGFVVGSAVEVLEAAKSAFLAEKDSQIAESHGERERQLGVLAAAEGRLKDSRSRVAIIIHVLISLVTIGLLLFFGLNGSIEAANSLLMGEFTGKIIPGSLLLLFLVLSVLNLVFGWSLNSPIKRAANFLAGKLVR